jgi:hypothetical protein
MAKTPDTKEPPKKPDPKDMPKPTFLPANAREVEAMTGPRGDELLRRYARAHWTWLKEHDLTLAAAKVKSGAAIDWCVGVGRRAATAFRRETGGARRRRPDEAEKMVMAEIVTPAENATPDPTNAASLRQMIEAYEQTDEGRLLLEHEAHVKQDPAK